MSENSILDKLPKLHRYDYILIWGHGLDHAPAIIDILQRTDDLELVKLVVHAPGSIQELLDAVYSYDYAPIEHLRDKTLYLLQSDLKVIVIFLKNLDAREVYMGKGDFRHVECQRIKQLKETIRNEFNPRIDGKRTEEHVIHASDNEHQTDHILKYLGYPAGVGLLKNIPNSLLHCPHHLGQFNRFQLKKVHHSQVFCNILHGSKDNHHKTVTPIDKTPHYLALAGDTVHYNNYLTEFFGTLLKDNHSLNNLISLSASFQYLSRGHENEYILAREFEPSKYLIMDGVHRVSILRSRNVDEFIIGVVPA